MIIYNKIISNYINNESLVELNKEIKPNTKSQNKIEIEYEFS